MNDKTDCCNNSLLLTGKMQLNLFTVKLYPSFTLITTLLLVEGQPDQTIHLANTLALDLKASLAASNRQHHKILIRL